MTLPFCEQLANIYCIAEHASIGFHISTSAGKQILQNGRSVIYSHLQPGLSLNARRTTEHICCEEMLATLWMCHAMRTHSCQPEMENLNLHCAVICTAASIWESITLIMSAVLPSLMYVVVGRSWVVNRHEMDYIQPSRRRQELSLSRRSLFVWYK